MSLPLFWSIHRLFENQHAAILKLCYRFCPYTESLHANFHRHRSSNHRSSLKIFKRAPVFPHNFPKFRRSELSSRTGRPHRQRPKKRRFKIRKTRILSGTRTRSGAIHLRGERTNPHSAPAWSVQETDLAGSARGEIFGARSVHRAER